MACRPDSLPTAIADQPAPPCDPWLARIHAQGERVHLPLGALCNNNCLFCMERDRDTRARRIALLSDEHVRWVLDRHRGAEEICFTSGEPTTHPRLLTYASWARETGYRRISLMTNGRRLAYEAFTRRLVRAGVNRIYVSLHGPTAQLHDGLTRTPGSFSQTMKGLQHAARYVPDHLDLHTSTVVTRRNIDHLVALYDMLIAMGVQQVVFNALQVQGRAAEHVTSLVPRYRDVCDSFLRVLDRTSDRGARAFLVDVPPCVCGSLPEERRGFFEQHVHYEVMDQGDGNVGATRCEGAGALAEVRTERLDEAFRRHGSPCERCKLATACPGVYAGYVEVFGWEEFVPVSA